MAKAKLASLDGLSEELKREYKQREDGNFYLTVDEVDGWALEDITGLRNTVGTTREERDKLQRANRAWEKLGVTVEEATDLIAQAKKFQDLDPKDIEAKSKVEIDARVEAANKKKDAEVGKVVADLEAKLLKSNKTAERVMKRQAATEAIIAAKGNPKLLLPIIEQQAVLVETDDGMRVDIVDEQGKVRYGKGGKEMDFEQLVEEIKGQGDYAGAFESETRPGTGMPAGSKKAQSGGNGKNRSQMTEAEQAAYIHDNGRNAYLSLPA